MTIAVSYIAGSLVPVLIQFAKTLQIAAKLSHANALLIVERGFPIRCVRLLDDGCRSALDKSIEIFATWIGRPCDP